MSSTRGTCPKCGTRLLFGVVKMRDELRRDILKTWGAEPKMACRRCGVRIRYVNRSKVSLVYWAWAIALAAAAVAAYWAWGTVAAVVGAVLFPVLLPIVMWGAEYKLADEGA